MVHYPWDRSRNQEKNLIVSEQTAQAAQLLLLQLLPVQEEVVHLVLGAYVVVRGEGAHLLRRALPLVTRRCHQGRSIKGHHGRAVGLFVHVSILVAVEVEALDGGFAKSGHLRGGKSKNE